MSSRRARAHAKHVHYCSCGARVHDNGGRAMHFKPRGVPREGHREVSETVWSMTKAGTEWAAKRQAQWDEIHGAKP